jgi:hypothetical protein
MRQAIKGRKQLYALLLLGVGPGNYSPGPFGLASVDGDVRNVGRDVDEIPRAKVDPRLQLFTEPQHYPSLHEVDGGFMSGVAMGLSPAARRERVKVST